VRPSRRSGVSHAAILVAFLPTPAVAQTIHWSATNGTWSNPSNWAGSDVAPADSDQQVQFNNSTAFGGASAKKRTSRDITEK
jgi:hypothetical protein